MTTTRSGAASSVWATSPSKRSACLESPGASALEGVETRANFKARRAERCAPALWRIQARGVTVNGCFILGLDEHGPEVFPQVLEYARSIPLYDVQITILTPFPGTPLYDRLLAEGRLIAPERWDLCTLFDVNYRPKRMSVDELRAGIRWLTGEAVQRRGDGCTPQAVLRGLAPATGPPPGGLRS